MLKIYLVLYLTDIHGFYLVYTYIYTMILNRALYICHYVWYSMYMLCTYIYIYIFIMYLCICIYIMCMYIYIFIYIHIYIIIHILLLLHIYIYNYTYIYICGKCLGFAQNRNHDRQRIIITIIITIITIVTIIIIRIKPLLKIFNECRSLTGVGKAQALHVYVYIHIHITIYICIYSLFIMYFYK